MVNFLDLLASLDFLSSEVSLTSQFNSRIKNPLGGCLSILLVIVGITFTVIFGYELVAKEKPITSTVDKIFDNSVVNLHDYPIAFAIMDNTAADLSTNSEFMASIKLIANLSVIPDANSGTPMRRVTYTIKDCDSDLMKPEFLDAIQPLARGLKLFCIDYRTAYLGDSEVSETPLVKNDYTSNDSSFLNIEVHRCTDGKEYCSDYKAPADAFYLNLFGMTSYLNLREGSEPVKTIPFGRTISVSYTLYKRSFIALQIGTLISDDGWLFEDNSEKTWVYEGTPTETTDVQSVRSGKMSILTFSSPRLRKVHYRRYLKVQELLAQIGGFLKAFLVICKFICKPFSKFVLFNRLNAQINKRPICFEQTNSVNNYVSTNSQIKMTKVSRKAAPRMSFARFLLNICSNKNKTIKEVTKYLEIGFISNKLIETEKEAKNALKLINSSQDK